MGGGGSGGFSIPAAAPAAGIPAAPPVVPVKPAPATPQTASVVPATPGNNASATVPGTTPGTIPGAGSGIPDTSFLSLLNNVNSGFQQNNQLVDQKNAVMSALLGNKVDPAKLATLPPDIQSVISGGNRDQLLLQAQIIDDALQGRNSSVASSIAYLTSGYQKAQDQYNSSLGTVLNYAKALNQKPSDVIKAMYPSILQQMSPDQLASLDKLGAPLLTSTQIPSMSPGGGTSGYDLSTYASAPNYVNDVTAIGQNIGPITNSQDAQSYISTNFPSSPITGDMVLQASNQYGVDPTVLMSVLQKESQFGSDGSQGATMNNPGNVGNTDGAMAAGQPVGYPDMQSGIDATAQWLANHKTASGTTNPQVQAYVDDFANGTISSLAQVPAAYKSLVATAMADQGTQAPLPDRRFTLAASAIVNNYIALPGYSLVANGLPYLGRIAAAEQNPGSVSDQDLLDSLTKLNTAGNAITDAQVSLITGGKSFADSVNVFQNKLANGGVLSSNQRQQVQSLANSIYANYAKEYQPIYDQATKQLSEAAIPQQFWTIPDLNALAKASGLTIPGVTDKGSGGAGEAVSNSTDPLGLGL